MKKDLELVKIIDSLLCRDKKKVFQKLHTLAKAGKGKTFVVSDFDRTITKSGHKKDQDISTWIYIRGYLSKEAREKCQLLYDKYRPLEIQNKMTIKDANNWYQLSFHISS